MHTARWIILYVVMFVGMAVGMVAFFDAAIDEAPVECFEGVFMERLQPHVDTVWAQSVWLCGKGLHYQLIQPDEDAILNHRTAEYYEQKELERDSIH